MNWLHFSLWVCGIYMLYYLIQILIDTARSGRSSTNQPGGVQLTFSEDVRPELLQHDEQAASQSKREPSMIASGGVSVREIFGLARKEMIVFTKAVSY